MTEPSNQCFSIIYDLRLLQTEILIINLFQRKRKFLLEECKIELMVQWVEMCRAERHRFRLQPIRYFLLVPFTLNRMSSLYYSVIPTN